LPRPLLGFVLTTSPPCSLPESALVEALLAEPQVTDEAETLAWRNGERWVQRIVPATIGSLPPAPALRTDGTYLVTGGLGELGLATALHVAQTARARLVLLARSDLPPRETWLQHLVGADDDAGPERVELTRRRIRHILAMEKLGSEVVILTVDVTDPVAMRRAVRSVRARYGPIHGVFHTAGILDDEILQLKSAQAAGATLAPKIRGTLVLQDALAGERPDFVLLFSSVSAILGAAGQIDYAAANAFLDAFAQAQAGSDEGNVLAVDWGPWRDIGMAAAIERRRARVHQRDLASTAAVPVHPLIDRCIRDQPDDRLYATRFGPGRHWLLDEHRTIGGGALIPGTGFLEIARAALATRPEAGIVEFEDILFLEPFCVDDGEERELFVHLRHKPDAGWAFSLTSARDGRCDDDHATTHVRGILRYVTPVEPERLPVSAIRARCDTDHVVIPSEQMRFGPRWNNVVRIRHGDREALIELAMPAAGADDPQALAIHPALFDMATAGAQLDTGAGDAGGAFFVPASYGRVRIHHPLTHRLFSHVRKQRNDADQNVATYDVTIADEHGLVLAEIRDFTMVRLRDTALLTRTGIAPATPAQGSPIMSDTMPGILRDEGMQVIERLLDGGLGPQVIVSPQDFDALLDQTRAAGRGRRKPGAGVSVAAPEQDLTPTEQLVASLWQELLGVETVGRDDDFFDLGGHSLLAVQFVNKLRKRRGVTVPATIFVEASTVAGLAARIAPADDAPLPDAIAGGAPPSNTAPARRGAEAVRLRAGVTAPPVFLVHDGLGEILLYRTLAQKLDPGRAVYGLQPETRSDGSVVHTEIQAMAAAHIGKVRQVQPNGPYLLAGLCAGGVIAVEMAVQLERTGEQVLYVGIIDAADVEARERPFFIARHRLRRFARTLGKDARQQGDGALTVMARKVGNYLSYEAAQRFQRAQARREVHDLRQRGTTSGAESAGETRTAPMAFLEVYKVAHREHRPSGMLSAPVVALYRATQGSGAPDDMPFSEQFSDCALGWGQRVSDGLQIVTVPGGHVSALQEPHVGTLARAMQDGIDSSLSTLEASYRARGPAQPVATRDAAGADAELVAS
jgi:thioesterase domain-containing protein/NAD(P)-dependent dehydrogenase (short-subunit alcohol dehydrogenase family)/acyl carrier protein